MSIERIEIVTGAQHRRRYSAEEKARFVAMAQQPGVSVSRVARQHGITPSLLFKWKKLMQEGGMSAIQSRDEVVSVAEYKALQKKAKQLEQLLGRKTMETEILKEALEIAKAKKLISRIPLLPPDDIAGQL
ncbi:transposase [Xenorhabdus griffiniae]|nr:transposase [Xenorhabdus griffiniae]MBE8587822.1 transposase [Xenorhabdus griffiniae]